MGTFFSSTGYHIPSSGKQGLEPTLYPSDDFANLCSSLLAQDLEAPFGGQLLQPHFLVTEGRLLRVPEF